MAILQPVWCEWNSREAVATGVAFDPANPRECKLRSRKATGSRYQVRVPTIQELLNQGDFAQLVGYNFKRFQVFRVDLTKELTSLPGEPLLAGAFRQAARHGRNVVEFAAKFSYVELARHSYYRTDAPSTPSTIVISKLLREMNEKARRRPDFARLGGRHVERVVSPSQPAWFVVPLRLGDLGLVRALPKARFRYSASLF